MACLHNKYFYNLLKPEIKSKISEIAYNKIIQSFLEEIKTEILVNKYCFTIPYLNVRVKLAKRKRLTPIINWKVSNENRKKLIEEGKEPARMVDRDSFGNAILSNENVWQEFYQDEFYKIIDVSPAKYKNEKGKLVFRNFLNTYWKFYTSSKLKDASKKVDIDMLLLPEVTGNARFYNNFNN